MVSHGGTLDFFQVAWLGSEITRCMVLIRMIKASAS
jgi:hypothetical protein